MPHRSPIIAGIAWFRADHWQLLRSLATDTEILEETFAEWEAIAEKTMRDLARRGLTVRKVAVDVNDLQEWCAGQGRPLDASARAAYAQAILVKENECT